jgi:hypothetical protein
MLLWGVELFKQRVTRPFKTLWRRSPRLLGKFLFIGFDLQFRRVVVGEEKAKHFLDIFGIRVGVVDRDDLIDNIDFEDMIENDKQVRVL